MIKICPQAFKFDRIGKQTSLVIQVVRGRSSEASFSWELGGSHAGASLYIKWPNGAPRPSMYFR